MKLPRLESGISSFLLYDKGLGISEHWYWPIFLRLRLRLYADSYWNISDRMSMEAEKAKKQKNVPFILSLFSLIVLPFVLPSHFRD